MSHTTKYDSVTPIHVPECHPWQNLSFFAVITQENLSLVSWVSSTGRIYLLFPGSAHNKVCLCLLGVPSRKENVTSWVSSPVRTYPCLLCACHLIAHGPGSWFACCAVFVCFFLFTDTEFYLSIISNYANWYRIKHATETNTLPVCSNQTEENTHLFCAAKLDSNQFLCWKGTQMPQRIP